MQGSVSVSKWECEIFVVLRELQCRQHCMSTHKNWGLGGLTCWPIIGHHSLNSQQYFARRNQANADNHRRSNTLSYKTIVNLEAVWRGDAPSLSVALGSLCPSVNIYFTTSTSPTLQRDKQHWAERIGYDSVLIITLWVHRVRLTIVRR